MSSQTMTKTAIEDEDQKTATVLAMEAFKLPHQTRLTGVPPKAANQQDDLDDFWDNVPV